MSDLRNRIYAVLKHQFGVLAAPHDADAVIAELGLRREELSEAGSSVLFNDNRPHHRYVTDWKADA